MGGFFSGLGSELHQLAGQVAGILYDWLPEWVRLPDAPFSLPHAAYWITIAVFPFIAVLLVQRATRRPARRLSLPTAYLLWLWGGLAGLHRFYVKSIGVGVVYVLLFMLILYGNDRGNAAREANSEAANVLRNAEFRIDAFQAQVDAGRAGAEERLAEALDAVEAATVTAQHAGRLLQHWDAFAGGAFFLIVILLIVDAVLLPRLVRICAAREAHLPEPGEYAVMARGSTPDPRRAISNPLIRVADTLSGWSGHFVAYWSIIAVFVYYYEVIARYVFNSPTNWAHESMFLMFGMQYLISGAYALREDAHVRVDVLFERFSRRNRALIDIITSFFFFVFVVALLVTGAKFAWDSMGVWEVSFTEWAIQYWPVKIAIPLGALLLLLQGAAKLSRDITYYRQTKAG